MKKFKKLICLLIGHKDREIFFKETEARWICERCLRVKIINPELLSLCLELRDRILY